MRFTNSLAALLMITAPAFADSQSESIRADLMAFNDQFNAYAASYDIEGIVSLYDEDALWIAPDAPPIAGQDTPRNTFTFLTRNQGSLSHTVDQLFISTDGTQAVMIGDVKVLVEKAGMNFEGTYLFVLERDDEDWEIMADMFHQYPNK